METGSLKSSQQGSKNSSAVSKSLAQSKIPAIPDTNTNEEKIARKNNKEVSLPLHDRPNPAKNIDMPVFKSNTIKVTQTLKAHTMAVSGLVIVAKLLVLVFIQKRTSLPLFQMIKFGRFGLSLLES